MNLGEVSADQLLAQELARMQRQNQAQTAASQGNAANAVDEQELYKKLTAPFPKEAYSCDSSRGFDLTSLKAQYVIERLNEVLGIMNWSHGGEYEVLENGDVLFKGALVITINGKQNRFFGTGFSAKKKNMGDSYKGAKTDSLSKCASQIGVGNDVFKGLINPKTFERASTVTTVVTTASVNNASETTASSETVKMHVPKMFERKSGKKNNVAAATQTSSLKKGL